MFRRFALVAALLAIVGAVPVMPSPQPWLPLVSAYLLAWNLDFPNSRPLAMLRKSEGAELENKVRRLDRITERYRDRLGKGL
jgi:hypothetical protein